MGLERQFTAKIHQLDSSKVCFITFKTSKTKELKSNEIPHITYEYFKNCTQKHFNKVSELL